MNDIYCALDIGGTYIRAAIFDKKKVLIDDIKKIRLNKNESLSLQINSIFSLMEKIMADNGIGRTKLRGIGISLAAIFSRKDNHIIQWPNNPKWKGLNIKEIFYKRWNVPVIMEDDVNCAAVGEYYYYYEKNYSNMICISIGTGIGSGIIINKQLFIGENGHAGEIGHISINKNGIKCNCGNRGCIQSYASGPAIIDKVNKQLKAENPLTNNLVNSIQDVEKLKDNKNIERLINKIIFNLTRVISHSIMTLDISLIVCTGGIIDGSDFLFKKIKEHLPGHLLNLGRKIDIKKSRLFDKSNLIGAVQLLDNFCKRSKI
jgi:predicted NBD/HSP70 family sugar kinase